MDEHKKKIINHISRLEGQLAAVKNELMNDAPDCTKASQTLLSASRSFAGLREGFVEAFLKKHFVRVRSEKDSDMLTQLLTVIKG